MHEERQDRSLYVVARRSVTRRQLLRAAGIGGMAVGLPGVLAACGSDSSTGTGAAAGTGTGGLSNTPVDSITWGLGGEISTFDVAKADYMLRMHILATEPVVKHDDKLNVVGHLAESWKQVDDVTYVYKVRPGVKFWDGSPLTAEDVAYAMARHTDPKVASLLAGIMPKVEFIKATSDSEVTVKLKEPNATWARIPTYMCVASKKSYEQYGKDFGAATAAKGNLMGTGPYIIERAKAGESVEYVRNESYWGEKPVARKFKFALIKDAQTSLLAARAGDYDGTFEVAPSDVDDWKGVPNFNVLQKASAEITFVSFDVESKPWDDIHVRKAFAHAFDREGIIKSILEGNATVLNSIVPRSQWGGSASKEKLDEIYNGLPVYDFDLDKAKAELEQSAYPDGLDAKIWAYATGAHQLEVAWAANLKKIGVNLKIDAVTDEEGTAREEQHQDLGMSIHGGWTPYYADPIDRPLTFLLSSAAKAGAYNEANYKNPEVDRLIHENLRSSDQNQRTESLARVIQIAQEDLPYMPLWSPLSNVALQKGLGYEGWSPWYETQFWISRIKSAA